MTVVRSIQSRMAKHNRNVRAQIYHDPRWRGIGGTRTRVIDRANGWCEWGNCPEPATIVDHYPWPLAELLTKGADPYNEDFCRALCAHHSGKADGGRT